jgi:hypothetical protein
MTTVSVTPVHLLAGLGVLVTVLWIWRSGVNRARRAADVARRSARLASLAGRVLVTAAVIVGVQWIVVTHAPSTTLLLVVLGLPALFAAHTLTRALTITTFDPYSYPRSRRGGGRR